MVPTVRSRSASAASRRPIAAIRPVASANRQSASTLGPKLPGLYGARPRVTRLRIPNSGRLPDYGRWCR
jgi:hypothetical protein